MTGLSVHRSHCDPMNIVRCFMKIVPLRDELFFPLEQTFNKFFEDFFSTKSNLNVAKANSGYPKLNSYLDGENYKLCFAVPGVLSEDLEVEYGQNKSVTIKGKTAKKYQSPPDSSHYVRELRLSSFERTIGLPDLVEGEPESAVLSDGILTLTWKLNPKSNPYSKRIAVKSE